MRRFFCLVVLVLLIASIGISAYAAVEVSSMSVDAKVKEDSSCKVTLKVTIHIDKSESSLVFPLPKEATNVKVNGNSEPTTVSGDTRQINLTQVLGKVTGDFMITITYELDDAVHTKDGDLLELRVPLASGFAYPIKALSFSVNLPDDVEYKPTFESGYHQANIETDIEVFPIAGSTVSGYFTEELKDYETVVMKLRVTEDMFPQTLADTQDYTFALYGMAICGGLALVYWLIFLRSWPFRKMRTTEPLQGITAGEIPCVMNLQGANLHLTVLTWARLGYIMIYLERGDRVVLRRRMDMGNERKEAEQKLFRKLFSKGDVVATTSLHYASLTLAVEQKPFAMGERIHRHSGNLKVFRGLVAGIGLFGGICVAVAMTNGAFLQGLLILLLSILGAVTGWYVQKWGCSLLPFNRHRVLLCFGICLGWLLLGWISGAMNGALPMVLGLLAGGLFLATGGRRTDLGKTAIAETLGLRSYLRSADKMLLQRQLSNDPDCFFAMAPYAMSLGVATAFARRFGHVRMGPCPYLTTGKEENVTAEEWVKRLSFVVEQMGERARQLPKERTVNSLRNLSGR